MTNERNWDEFKDGSSEWPSALSRRDFLELAGATLALAGVTGCTRPPRDPVFPYVQRPEDLVPGQPTYFTTARSLNGWATGILVETHMGRPTKVEGNPDHPASLGAATAILQASLLELYDPDRNQDVKLKGAPSSWSQFQKHWQEVQPILQAHQGEGVIFLTEISTSPTLQSQMQDFKKQFPQAEWIQYDPLYRRSSLAASRDVFGENLDPVFNFQNADVIVSFDADFLASPEFPVVYARDYMQRRRQWDEGKPLNELCVFESALSLTGLKANRRQAISAKAIEDAAVRLHRALQKKSDAKDSQLSELAAKIQAHKNRCLFIAGSQQPASVHRLCHFLNAEYGQGCVTYRASSYSFPDQMGHEAIQTLQKKFASQKPRALFVVGCNPIYSLPRDLEIQKLIQNSELSVYLGKQFNETAQVCEWSLPMSDDFEAWSDSSSFDGTQCILQPVVERFYDSRNLHELISLLLGPEGSSSFDIIRSHWQKKWGARFENNWKKALQSGVIADSKSATVHPKVRKGFDLPDLPKTNDETFEVVWKPSLTLYDGRFANIPWLQELPDPISQVTWDNVAMIGASNLKGQKIQNGQILEISCQGQKLEVPAWIVPGIADGTLVLPLGYGRTQAGKVGSKVGFNAVLLQRSDALDFAPAEISVKNKFAELACAQTDRTMEGREPIHTTATVKEKIPAFSVYPETPPEPTSPEAWGMVIDLDSCIGCSACVIACQSENNIPVVGKKGVLLGREMHWIRVDRYEDGGFQPVPCMHCEKAPCEPVCPVGATVHSTDGLNQMIYNRCVGTRYCSNNCPYKVRRFNFLHFAKDSKLEKLQRNPDVSVRPRGVMEKCTYCVQRINKARIQSQLENRNIQEGEVKTACQQTCPTQAIVFGNLNQTQSAVKKLKSSPRNYSLLEELGTKPRTTYLAKLSKQDLQGGSHG